MHTGREEIGARQFWFGACDRKVVGLNPMTAVISPLSTSLLTALCVEKEEEAQETKDNQKRPFKMQRLRFFDSQGVGVCPRMRISYRDTF